MQVHRNDEYAQKYEHDNGKTEMWYIISADNGAGIYCGFKRDTDKEEFLAKVKDGTVEELLNFIPVNVGYSWGIIRVGSLLPTRFSFPHAILMRFNPNRIVAN